MMTVAVGAFHQQGTSELLSNGQIGAITMIHKEAGIDPPTVDRLLDKRFAGSQQELLLDLGA